MPPGRYVRLTVADTGPGISASEQAQIFHPFYTTKTNGTGLGLAEVQAAVEKAAGFIVVESAVKRGSRFSVLFPAVEEETARLWSGSHAAQSGHRPAVPEIAYVGTILVAENDPAVRRVACRILGQGGHAVLEASDGREALALALERPREIDLLLTDLMMPELTGHALAEAIRENQPDFPVVFMSGGVAAVQEVLPRSHNAFIAKPFSPRELLDVVSTLLRPVMSKKTLAGVGPMPRLPLRDID